MPILIQSGRFGAAAFSPLSLSPWAWIDPSDATSVTLNGSNVSQINDKSGNGRHLSQGTAANQPAYTSAGINGLNHLTFDATDTLLGAAATRPTLCTVFIVAQQGTVGVASHVYFSGGDSTAFGLTNVPPFRPNMYSGTLLTSSVNADTSLHLITCTFNGASSSVAVDATVTTGNAGSAAPSSNVWSLARDIQKMQAGTKIGELLIYGSVISGTDLTNVTSYLKTKWGTP